MMLAWDHWHIEISSICTLQCPRCPRAEVPESLLNRQLTLDFFKNQIGKDIIAQIRKITFCGNDGDPIYCRDFLEICSWIKQINPGIHLVLITNGSYKSSEWWATLGKTFNKFDEVHWSIDGWDQHSNQQYRVNCNWESIVNGIWSFAQHNTDTYKVWASIAFRFNQNHIVEQQKLAEQHGFDLYQLTKSTKFGSKYPATYGQDDLLEPSDSNLVASGLRFQRENTTLSTKIRPGGELKITFLQRANELDKQNKHSGICLIGNKGVFLNSRGEFYPCCWTANRYPHNADWHNLAETKFNLHNTSFDKILSDPFWSTEFLKFNSNECRTKCTPNKLKDIDHVSEW